MKRQPTPLVYLIDDGRWLKIGYSGNPKLRTQKYITENPTARVIETIPFNTEQQGRYHEAAIHEVLSDYCAFDNSKEWFDRRDEVWNFFFHYRNRLGFGAPHVDVTLYPEPELKPDLALDEPEPWREPVYIDQIRNKPCKCTVVTPEQQKAFAGPVIRIPAANSARTRDSAELLRLAKAFASVR